jgi:hypothetical protein
LLWGIAVSPWPSHPHHRHQESAEIPKDFRPICRSHSCWHDGKEAKRMARKDAELPDGAQLDQSGDSPGSTKTVKVTLHLTVGTAQRLGVESAMRRISQSSIAEEVLAAYLSRWQLPVVPDSNRLEAG